MTKQKTKGVLLIALGNPQYGRMAYNLANSLKQTSPEIPVHLVYEGISTSHLDKHHLGVFDSVSKAPAESYTRNGNIEYIKVKTWMYELSPFDTTIFLDVDMMWLTANRITQLFDQLQEVDYTIQNRDYVDMADPELNPKYSIWADVTKIRDAYKFKKGKYYSLHSEFVYFKKTKQNQKFFNEWRNQYDNLKVDHTVFGGGIPDELPLAIATVIHERYPHKDAFLPIYWERAHAKLTRTELLSQFYGYSIGGNRITGSQEKTYNDLAKYYANKRGDRGVFKTKSKTTYLPERANF